MPVFKVEGMSCQHCVAAITRSIQALDGVAGVEVDLASGVVRVASNVAAQALLRAFADAGYAATLSQG